MNWEIYFVFRLIVVIMKYNYTWNHISLFATICECGESSHTIGENWINILSNHQDRTFPFTLWPLTYRTSTLMASPSIVSPMISSIPIQKCEMNVKFYRSNEVIVICFIHKDLVDNSIIPEDEEVCKQMCIFDTIFTQPIESIHGIHEESPDETEEALVSCGLLNTYRHVKKIVMNKLSICRYQPSDSDVSCILCTGHGVGAAMANFMATDLASDFKDEQEFMNQDKPSVVIDCVTFSSPTSIGNNNYWTEFESLVDKHIDIRHIHEEGDHSRSLVVGKEEGENIKKDRIGIDKYIEDINKKIFI